MNSTTSAIGALILVPIIIAVSAAFIALKASDLSQQVCRFIKKLWTQNSPLSNRNKSRRRRKLRRSNLTSSQLYADSWCDLESIDSRGYSSPIREDNSRNSYCERGEEENFGDSATRVWHPSRSTRLMWSFTSPKSRNLNHFALSNVARPSPAARRPERLSAEDAALLAHPTRAMAARRGVSTDL